MRLLADAGGVALLHVVDPAPQHAAGPARRRLLDGVEHVAPCGVEVDREGQPAAVVVKFALEQVAHRAGFGLGEGTPVAIEVLRSEEHTSELQSLMRISYAVFCLKKKKQEFT